MRKKMRTRQGEGKVNVRRPDMLQIENKIE